MSDIKENTKKVDLHYVDPKDQTEVEYMHSKYPWIDKETIRSVIQKEGPERKHIEDCLNQYHS